MSRLLHRLGLKEQRGSKPRCHWLTHGAVDVVSGRLTALTAPWATVSTHDRWMPEGFDATAEAQLPQAPRLLDPDIGRRLANWWLPPDRLGARTPNFDIAGTCTIEGAKGLLLLEAKAHSEELNREAVGRRLGEDASEECKASHVTIDRAIMEARSGLSAATGLDWQISRDSHYQMSNRFAWSWKLADLGIPVVLVYLGFLAADEMADQGEPFADHDSWDRLAKSHSRPLFPDPVWNQRWSVNGVPFIPLIRSLERPFDREAPP